MITISASTKKMTILIAIFGLASCVAAPQHSPYDEAMPEASEISASLQLAREMSTRAKLSAKDLLLLYRAEKNIGRSVWGLSPKFRQEDFPQLDLFSFCPDSEIAAQAVAYIRTNRHTFRVVDDGWKGEDNFWEPSDTILVWAQRSFPGAIETKEIEFDLEFNQFIRRFWIDPEAQGKTCEQYCKEALEENGEVLRESFTEAELTKWPAECVKEREDFEVGRRRLLSKYKNAPFTKILSDIDVTTIVVHYGVD